MVEVWNGTGAMQNSCFLSDSLKSETQKCHLNSNSTPKYVSQNTESRNSRKYFYAHVHSSNIHNNQKIKTIQMTIDGPMDKKMIYACDGIWP